MMYMSRLLVSLSLILVTMSIFTHAPAAPTSPAVTPPAAKEVVDFWRKAGHAKWFTKDPAFDREFRERFDRLYLAAARRELTPWLDTPDGALALLILLDQYPRNAFRGTPSMFATDPLAVEMADAALARGHDRALADQELLMFMYMPFAHSERLIDQQRSVKLNERLGPPHSVFAKMFHDIVERFGRFPHRNPILLRQMRPEEKTYLDTGGYKG